MTLFIGIDEAGYGPNLGPLVVAVTVWEVKAESGAVKAEGIDLYERLAEVVSAAPEKKRIAIADSKLLYQPKRGLANLERGVLTSLTALGKPATDWQTLLSPPALPWYTDYNCPLPIDATGEEVAELAGRFLASCEAASVRLVDMCARLVFPREFNDLTELHGTKGAALSHVSIGLLREVLDRWPESGGGDSTLPSALTDGIHVTFDKHGGRNRYAELLQHYFPDQEIETLLESRPASRYRWGPSESRVEVCFRTKGEAELPTALASMTAKYHRELAMRAFNAFWAAQIPGLKPTAGYPQDAKRFKKEIAAVQSKLGIDDRILWRNR